MNARLVYIAIIIPLIMTPSLPVVYTETSWYGECTLPIAAVSSSGEGVIGNLTVRIVKPGSGLIFVSTSPAVEVDVQGAARIAVLAASLVAGFNPLGYDYYFLVSAPSIIIGGPSAGAAMALGVLLAIENYRCDYSYVVTGMINPDTTIGPVGGLKEKLEATASIGAKIFYIPSGQSNYTYQERVIMRRGPFTFITWRSEAINLVEYGSRLGVRVVEVPGLPSLYSRVAKVEVRGGGGELGDSMGLLRVANTLIGNVSLSLSNLAKLEVRGDLVDRAVKSLEEAKAILESNGGSYAAIVKALEAASLAQVALWARTGLDLDTLYSNITRDLEEFNVNYEGIQSPDISVIELKGLAYLHAWTAGMLLNTTYSEVKSRGYVTLGEAYRIARALWEARVARLILDEAKPLNASIDAGSLKLISGYLTATTRTLAAYSTQVFSEAGAGQPPVEAVDMALSASITRDLVASLFLSIRSMALMTKAIHESFQTSMKPFEEASTLAESIVVESSSSVARALLKSAITLRDYQLLTEAMLLAWAIKLATGNTSSAIEGSNATKPQTTQQPQVLNPMVEITRGNMESNYSKLQEILRTIVGTSITALTIAIIALAAITILTFLAYRRLGGSS